MKRILLISSSGGHWIQLCRLANELVQYDKFYACSERAYAAQVAQSRFFWVPDATRWEKRRLIHSAIVVLILLLRVRPHAVITTGAAPGFFAIVFGKMLRMKTVWLDSVANVEEMSGSGKKVRIFADLWLTQHEVLSGKEGKDGPRYVGSVI